jgi:hypothetical protein
MDSELSGEHNPHYRALHCGFRLGEAQVWSAAWMSVVLRRAPARPDDPPPLTSSRPARRPARADTQAATPCSAATATSSSQPPAVPPRTPPRARTSARRTTPPRARSSGSADRVATAGERPSTANTPEPPAKPHTPPHTAPAARKPPAPTTVKPQPLLSDRGNRERQASVRRGRLCAATLTPKSLSAGKTCGHEHPQRITRRSAWQRFCAAAHNCSGRDPELSGRRRGDSRQTLPTRPNGKRSSACSALLLCLRMRASRWRELGR